MPAGPVITRPTGTTQRNAAANTQLQPRASVLSNFFRNNPLRRRLGGGGGGGSNNAHRAAAAARGGQENAAKQLIARQQREAAIQKQEAALLPPGVRECVICMEKPRSTRFGCGHALCCADCAAALKRTSNRCPGCRMKIDVAVARGAHLSLEATFIPPTAVEAPECGACEQTTQQQPTLLGAPLPVAPALPAAPVLPVAPAPQPVA